MVRDSRLNISDSVVMGDVHQNITNIQHSTSSGVPCPACGVINAILIQCTIPSCRRHFCGLCHPRCRWSDIGVFRFDSGKGHGPYCRKCMDLHTNVRLSAKLESKMKSRKFMAILATIIAAALIWMVPSGEWCFVTSMVALTYFGWTNFFVTRSAYRRALNERP